MRRFKDATPGASRDDSAAMAATPGKSTMLETAAPSVAPTAHAARAVPRLQLSSVKGGAQNVDLSQLNNHQGFDPNRIGDRHHNAFHTTKASRLYRNDGQPIGSLVIPASKPVYINAGAITKLVIHDPDVPAPTAGHHVAAVDCVYIWNYDHNSGWMPASCLPAEVSADQHAIASRIEHQRDDHHHHFGGGIPLREDASAAHDGVIDLFTYPHQGIKKHHKAENMAKYYYGNLALNLPDTGAERVGVIAVDIPGETPEDLVGPKAHPIDPYREFYPEQPHKEAAIPLYHRGSYHKADKSLHFVYGYVKDDAGARLYGWINKSMLSQHHHE